MTTESSLALATRDLRKSYGSRLALDGLDLSVPTGVVYGFLGPNGAIGRGEPHPCRRRHLRVRRELRQRPRLALVTFPGAYDLILSFMFGLGGLFAVIYGAAIAGSEWTWGTLKTAVVRGESRSRYLLTTFAAIAVVLAVGLLITFVIGVAGAALGSTIAGISLDAIGDMATLGGLPELFARGWVAITATAALGFAVATLARSQLAGIGVGIAFYFAETFAGIFLPDVVRYMPFHLSEAAVGGAGGFGGPPDPGALPIGMALFLVTVWLVGSLVVATGFSERAEITG